MTRTKANYNAKPKGKPTARVASRLAKTLGHQAGQKDNSAPPKDARAAKQTDKVTAIFGPSHAIRWKWHVRDGVVSSRLPAEAFVGLGGAPIWSQALFNAASDAVRFGGNIALLIGDIRFGNGIARDQAEPLAKLFQDGYLGIEPRALTPEIDRRMLRHVTEALGIWQTALADRVRFVFWDLFGRQVFDRLSGQHIVDRCYAHPVFNYHDIAADHPEALVLDLSPLLQLPMHEIRRLFIDRSCHPSQIGYLLLENALCNDLKVSDAYAVAVSEVETQLQDLARSLANTATRPVLLTGRSVWLDTLSAYMGKDGAAKLAAAGLVIAPLDRLQGQSDLPQILATTPLTACIPVVISSGADITGHLAKAFGTDHAYWRDLPHIVWEQATEDIIRKRGETPRFDHTTAGAQCANRLTLVPHMVEQGPLGQPSFTGLRHILQVLDSDLAGCVR